MFFRKKILFLPKAWVSLLYPEIFSPQVRSEGRGLIPGLLDLQRMRYQLSNYIPKTELRHWEKKIIPCSPADFVWWGVPRPAAMGCPNGLPTPPADGFIYPAIERSGGMAASGEAACGVRGGVGGLWCAVPPWSAADSMPVAGSRPGAPRSRWLPG